MRGKMKLDIGNVKRIEPNTPGNSGNKERLGEI